MTVVLIALADVGPGVQLEEHLVQAGLDAKWDQAQANGPTGGAMPTVVLLDADHLGKRLAQVAEAWRDYPSVPGVLAIGSSAVAREQAPAARVTLVAPTAKLSTLVTAIREAEKLRLASGMRWSVLRAACGLPPAREDESAWPTSILAARNVDIEIARSALRWHVHHYVTPTARIDVMREERMLSVPELEVAAQIDGTLTVQSIVKVGPLDPTQTARFLWALGSTGAVEFTPEIRDVATPARRMLAEVRAHLRARTARLEKSTYYDVLEITPLAEYEEIEAACQLVAFRYAPDALDVFDLADLKPLAQPIWSLIEKARSVLVDHSQRGRYHDWLQKKMSGLRTIWAIEPSAIQTGADYYLRGQRSLGEGDVHKAMGEFATACRHFPGHPEYEAHLSWARYRVQVASGRDRAECAAAERKTIEAMLWGCKPWPRALVALSLICAAGGDADSARWHLHGALTVDPKLPAAVQLAARLGMRR
ncbi:MAG: J domain-containing protein [Myxococcota bacterium]|nr:J domain-containing protein [Myxococcota bacterium]